MYKLALILPIVIAIVERASAVCNGCNPSNGMACVNETAFHPCVGGIANTSVIFSCLEDNHICTQNARVCVDKTLSSVTPACGDTTNCGKCNGEADDGKFTCTSRTKFAMCLGGTLTELRDTCPKNQMCDLGLAKQGQYPCVPNCRAPKIEFCDIYDAVDEPVTTTKEPATTATELPKTTAKSTLKLTLTNSTNIAETTGKSGTTTTVFAPIPSTPTKTTTQNPVNRVCAQQAKTGRMPHPTDSTCRSYINCFKKGGNMQSVILKCPNNRYYNPSTTLCSDVKPVGCI